MIELGLVILIVVVMLVIAVVLLPLAKLIHVPHSILLTLSGILIGFLLPVLGGDSPSSGDVVSRLDSSGLGAEAIFYLLLVPMIFDSALRIDVGLLIDDLAPILLLAIVGTILCIVLIGYSLSAVTEFSLVACLLIGAICASTDPLPVQEVFDEVGVPKRVDLLAEGESLFSDSTALVAFALLIAMLTGESEPGFLAAVFSFLEVSVGGALTGYLFARLFCWMIGFVGDSHIAKNTLSVCMGFVCYIVTEDILGLSGVIAIVTSAFVLGTYGRASFSPTNWSELINISGQINFVAKSLVFVLVGVTVPSLVFGFSLDDLGFWAILFVAAFAARAATVFLFLPAMTVFQLAEPVSNSIKMVMFWGASRGAISLALALAILEMPGLGDELKSFVSTMVCFFVLSTLFINSTTMHPLLNLLKMRRLGKLDLAIKDRAIFDALTELSDELARQSRDASNELQRPLREAVAGLDERSRVLFESMPKRNDLESSDWIVIALTAIAQYEQRIYLKFLENRLISQASARALLSQVSSLIEGTRHAGKQGYCRASEQGIRLRWKSSVATWIYFRLNISYFLRIDLTERFHTLYVQVLVMEEIAENSDARVAKFVYRDQMGLVNDAIHFRLNYAKRELEKLNLAYPEYGQQLEQRLHQLSIVRLEQQKYRDMLESAIIGEEVYGELHSELEKRVEQLSRSPNFNLELYPLDMLDKLPSVASMNQQEKHEIAKHLVSKLVMPGEKIIAQGDPGSAIYFIASGIVRVMGEDECLLGSGLYFGDQAIAGNKPEQADVYAVEYCRLLVLDKNKLEKLNVGLVSL